MNELEEDDSVLSVGPEGSSARVMIVEDEAVLAEMTRLMLDRWGYQVAGVLASGEEAVADASRLCPDLILMDVRLDGEIDGLEAARRIAGFCATPVLFTTGYGHVVGEEELRWLGARSLVLSKPVSPQVLREAIERLLSPDREAGCPR